jgi:hypothetical protein
VLGRKLVFVSGKGGVGKTSISQALAQALAQSGHKTLWTTFEDPTLPMGELQTMAPNLWHLNTEAGTAFEEYAALKLGGGKITQLFVQNKLMRYLAKAAPGVHELVLLGKVWWERSNYDRVIVDMPSTGYGLTMFQSTKNFSTLFRGGPIQKDAENMLATFGDARECGHLIVALPEEMPLVEGLELDQFLKSHFPDNPAGFVANRLFPSVEAAGLAHSESASPIVTTVAEYARNRSALETHNLRLWRDLNLDFGEIEYVPPTENPRELVPAICEILKARKYVA